MIAYNREWHENFRTIAQAGAAWKDGLLSDEEWAGVQSAHPVGFYTPNFFIRIGLFLLTLLVGLFSFGLLLLIFLDGVEASLPLLAIFFGIVWYVALELVVGARHHYRSGVTEALIWSSAAAFSAGITELFHLGPLGIYAVVFVISSWLALRFTDVVATIVSFSCFLMLLLHICVRLGPTATNLSAFVLMAVCCSTYFLVRMFDARNALRHYKLCLRVLEIVALLYLYALGNVFVMDALQSELLASSIAPTTYHTFRMVFWLTTCLIPPAYVAIGIIKKDALLYRVGLVLIIAMVLTIRNYYHLLPFEMMMSICGAVLISITYWLIQFLKTGKYVYSSKKQDQSFAALQVESIILAETFSSPLQDQGTTKFGGGNFGGGGAGDSF